MLGRRSFLIASGWTVTALALAKEPPLLAVNRRQVPLADSSPRAEPVLREARVLKIEGWDTPFVTENAAGSQMWISINQSWRANWR